jgi:hypothetical protein
MVSIDKFNRAIVILASVVLPSVGILIGLYYTLRPEREEDYLGPLCIFLGFVTMLAVWLAVGSL